MRLTKILIPCVFLSSIMLNAQDQNAKDKKIKDSLDFEMRKLNFEIQKMEFELRKEEVQYKKKETEFKGEEVKMQKDEIDFRKLDYLEKRKEKEELRKEKEELKLEKKRKAEEKLIRSTLLAFVRPLSLITGGIDLGVERVVKPRGTIHFNLAYFDKKVKEGTKGYSFYRVGVFYRQYLDDSKPVLNGMYVGTGFHYQEGTFSQSVTNYGSYPIYTNSQTVTNYSISTFTPSFIVGVQTVMFTKLMVDFYIGGGYSNSNNKTNFDTNFIGVNNDKEGVKFLLNMSFSIPLNSTAAIIKK